MKPVRALFPLTLAAAVAAGIAALAQATEGFRVVTSEQARRLAVEETPRLLPNIALTDQNGGSFSLADYHGKPLLVEFIYTRCPGLCTLLGDDFQRIEDAIRRSEIKTRVGLLSISFDVEHDEPPDLKLYGERYGAIAPAWRVAVPSHADLVPLLQAFGVVVIPDGVGGFVHNAALYLVDATGHLVRIMDQGLSTQQIDRALTPIS